MSKKNCVFCGTDNDSEAFFCRNKECGKNLSMTKDTPTLEKTKKTLENSDGCSDIKPNPIHLLDPAFSIPKKIKYTKRKILNK